MLQNIGVVVNVENQERTVFLRQANSFIVDQAAVFDRIDARQNRRFDAFRTMCVCGYFAIMLMRFGDKYLHFFQRVLLITYAIAFGQHATCRTEFDEVGTVLDDFTNLRAHFPWTISNALVFGSKLRRQQVVVAMSASDTERRSGHTHPRPDDFAIIDRVA